jgi:hypothetical protein
MDGTRFDAVDSGRTHTREHAWDDAKTCAAVM